MPTIKQIRDDAAKAVGNVTDQATKRVEGVTAEVTKSSEAARAEATRVVTDPTPLYAVVGLTDSVVEAARETVTETVARAGKVGKALSPKQIGKTVSDKAAEVSKLAESLPGRAAHDVTGGLGRVQEGYHDLAKRGQGLVGRVKDQQATKDLTKQVATVVEQGKQLLDAASKGVTDTRSAARATVTTGRRRAADTVADVVAGEDVTVAAPTRKPASKRAATTKKATSKAAPKSTATKKAATKKATSKAAPKSTATKSTATKKAATSKAAPKSTATKSTATKKAASTTKRPTTTAAKRTVSTASNAVAKTAEKAQDVVTETTKVADKAVEVTTATAAKVGD